MSRCLGLSAVWKSVVTGILPVGTANCGSDCVSWAELTSSFGAFHAEHNSSKEGAIFAGSGGFAGITAKFVPFVYA